MLKNQNRISDQRSRDYIYIYNTGETKYYGILMKITYRSLMFAFDVVIEHFFEWEHLIAILTCVFEFNAFSVHFHEMSPILK